MKASLILLAIVTVMLLSSAPAAANPTLLPNHPGYPMNKAVDPVLGQPLANDPGQSNATGEEALLKASTFDDSHVMQSLSFNPNEKELRERSDGDVSPKVEDANKTKEHH